MTEFTIIVKNQNYEPVKDAKVTVNGDFPQYTDTEGKTHYNINEWNIQLRILATKNLSKTEGTISVDLLGRASPDELILTLHFDPTSPISQPIAGIAEEMRRAAWMLPLAIITTILIVGVMLYGAITRGNVSSRLAEIKNKVESKT